MKWTAGLGAAFLVFYSLTAFRLPVNYADSDDLTLAAYFGGLAHPPGYPVLTLGLHQILKLLPVEKVAWGANLAAAAVSALNVGLIGWAAVKFIPDAGPKTRKWAGILTAVSFGLWQSIWLHARVLEVFPLAQTGMILGTGWLLTGRSLLRLNRRTIGGGIILGLGAFYHPLTLIYSLPLLGWLKSRRAWLLFGLAWIAAFGIYAVGVTPKPDYSWPVPRTVNEVIRFYTRMTYTTGGSAIESMSSRLEPAVSLKAAVTWFEYWFDEAHGLGWGLILYGAWMTWRGKSPHRIWLLTAALLAGVGISMYLKYPQAGVANEVNYFWGKALRWRMQFVMALVAGWWMTFGWAGWLQWCQKWRRWPPDRTGPVMLAASVALAGWGNYQSLVLDPTWMPNHAQEVLHSLPVNSYLLVDNDLVFAFWVQQKLYSVRPDLVIRSLRFDLQGQTEAIINLPFDRITAEDEAVERLLTNLTNQGEKVYLYAPSAALLAFAGVEGNPFYAAPDGYLLVLSRTMPDLKPKTAYPTSQKLISQPRPKNDWWLGFRAQLAAIHAQQAYYWERLGYTEAADGEKRLGEALALMPQTAEAMRVGIETGEWAYQTHNSYAAYTPTESRDYLARLTAQTELTSTQWEYLVSRAVMLDPANEKWQTLLPDY